MSSKRGRFENEPPTATSLVPDVTDSSLQENVQSHSGLAIPTVNTLAHCQDFSGQMIPHNFLQIPNTSSYDDIAQTPTLSDLLSTILTSPDSLLLPPLSPLCNLDLSGRPILPHTNCLSPYIPDINLGINPGQSSWLTNCIDPFSASFLLDLKEFNSVNCTSTNSLTTCDIQPQTSGHSAVSSDPPGDNGHLVGQSSQTLPTQYTTEEHKISIERNPNFEITYTVLASCQWDTCIQQFFCITDLVEHIEETHIHKEIMKSCVCLWRNCKRNKKPFNARCVLISHLRIHTGDKPHKCTVSSNITTCFS